ncbi:MAG: hydrolase [Planctomycetes bacterium]|nr:hydrolase [Planctomycetota bacterium]
MLDSKNCCLIVIDVQGKLAELMHQKDSLFKNIQILINAANLLSIPILWTQQCPDVLGPTTPRIAHLLIGNRPINKATFSCCGSEQFNSKLKTLNRNQLILCGIETHICVYQTAIELLETKYDVTVVADAVSSRTQENKNIALNKMQNSDINITGTEMILFELLKTAEHPQFKQIAKLIK